MASYRKKHVKTKIHKIKPKKSVFKKMWFWITFLFVVVFLSIFYFVLFYSGVQVKNIIISGNQKVSSQDIENLVSNNINNKILSVGSWKIDSKSIFLVNSKSLKKEILDKFPIIGSAKIDKKLMQTLDINVNERIPVAIFSSSSSKTGGKYYFMDESGIIFEPLYVVPQNMLIVRQMMDDNQIFVGEKVIQQSMADILLKIEKDLKDNFQINLQEALIASPVRLNITTDKNWQIYFDLSPDSNINSQLTNLNSLLRSGIPADDIKNLRYINLIPDNKAIICDNMECGSPH